DVCAAVCGEHEMNVVFFFSSRRRHTRSDRDWSSDVCSSDLQFIKSGPVSMPASRSAMDTGPDLMNCGRFPTTETTFTGWSLRERSEERRVGKECRARGARAA